MLGALRSCDTLKDLYHTVIDREIRHDFGEYYTPDWLARAVCEEVMDAEWRKETIATGGRQSADRPRRSGPILRLRHFPLPRYPTAVGGCSSASRYWPAASRRR